VGIIRGQVSQLFGKKASEEIRVIYGGSVSKDNALNYLQTKGVDGLLVGGASLDAHQFSEIVIKSHNTQG
jgi:triosephosphate isomerase